MMRIATYVCIYGKSWGHADGQVRDEAHSSRSEGRYGRSGCYQLKAYFFHAGEVRWVRDTEVIRRTHTGASTLRDDGRIYGYLLQHSQQYRKLLECSL